MSDPGHPWLAGGIILAVVGGIVALPFYCIYKDSQQQERTTFRLKEQSAREVQEESDFKAELEKAGYIASLDAIQLQILSRMSNNGDCMSNLHAKMIAKIEEERQLCLAKGHLEALAAKDLQARSLITQKALAFFRLLRVTSSSDVDTYFRCIDSVNIVLQRRASS